MNVTVRSVLLMAAGLAVAGLALARGTMSAPFIVGESEGTPEVQTESQLRAREAVRIRTLLFAGHYDSLDGLADSLRRYRVKNSIGRWRLRDFYLESFYDIHHASDAEYQRLLAALQDWRERHPQSITARVALAEAWSSYAAYARGDGPASQIASQKLALMASRNDSAMAALYDVAALPFCPGADAVLLMLLEPPEIFDVFERAVRRAPDYEGYYVTMANDLLPRWYGSRGSVGQLADSVAVQFGDDGKIISARMAWTLFDMYWRVPAEAGLSWAQTRDGMKLLRTRYPESREILNASAAMAWSERDLETARPLMTALGDRYDLSVWHDPREFAQARAWLLQEQERSRGDESP